MSWPMPRALSGYNPDRPVPVFEDDRPTRPRTLRRCRHITAVCSDCHGAGQLRIAKWYPGRAQYEACPACAGAGIDRGDE